MPPEPARRAFADPAPSLRAPAPSRTACPDFAEGPHFLSADRYPLSARHQRACITKQSSSTTSTLKSNTYASTGLLTKCVLRGCNPFEIKYISCHQPTPSPKEKRVFSNPQVATQELETCISKLQAPGSRLQAPGSRLQAPGSRLQAPSSQLSTSYSQLPTHNFVPPSTSESNRKTTSTAESNTCAS
jgi:hypothetical protein